MTTTTAAVAQVVECLGRAVPHDRIVVDSDVLDSLSRDQAAWAPVGKAVAAVRVRNTAEVAAVVKTCAELGVAVVARGAGTGLSGGANAVDGCVVIDLSRMNAIVEIDRDNLIAVVEPGVINDDLKAAVKEVGLWYPPDPASAPWSTIGGNIATNAGGLCCLKYGVTRDYAIGLEAVVGGSAGYGTVARLGRRTTKGVAGYDLVGLMCGSEGTLGIVTQATVRLRPQVTGVPRTIVGSFDQLVQAGEAVALITRRGIVPVALELLDRYCLEVVEEWKHLGLSVDAEALLLARVDTPGESGAAEAQAIADAFTECGAVWAEQSTDDTEAEALFAARRLAYPALERLGPVLTEDVCVPRSEVPGMLVAIEEVGQRYGVKIASIAHAGDGNLHPLIVGEAGDGRVNGEAGGLNVNGEAGGLNAPPAAAAAFEEILDAAIARRGTVTGEHGVGILKAGGMQREVDPATQTLMRDVKRSLDPRHLFNPGKVLTDR
ncbi:MAG TPA: FAD-linked oxidase C-terminal domain-containing protein [Mycobacteriales bacterium]|nr:FAD-linked oxidase C-terminal domain-containing protein [Mycobacteriales bacterium]